MNFREKITQLLVNPYTVVLALFIVKLFFFSYSLANSLGQAKSQTHLLHDSVQNYASNILSFPHYMAKSSNIIIAKSLGSANKGLEKTLQLILTASENLLYFIVELSVGTYACLLTAAIDDTAIAALNATESLISLANQTLISFAKDLNDGLEDLSEVINEVIDTADDTGDALEHLFGKSSHKSANGTVETSLHHVNLTISSMKNWQISGNINDKIEKLKKEIPDFADVQNFTRKIIDKPFTEMKRQVSVNLNSSFTAEEMYVPKMVTLDFSNETEDIDNFYSHLIDIVKMSTHIVMGIISVLIVLVICYEFFIECKDWKRVEDASQHLNFTNESFLSTSVKKKYNIEVIKIMQSRKADFISLFLIDKIFRIKDPITTNNIRWIINYAASSFLLPVLLLGILGTLSAGSEYLILALIMRVDFKSTGSKVFYNTKTEIFSNFNSSLNQWTNETNSYILNYQEHVNDNVFAWFDTTATTINNTVTEFDTKMNSALDSLFKGTPLYKPIEQIVGCVVESKLKKIEKAMSWISDNAVVNMPLLDPKGILQEITEIRMNNETSSFENKITDFKNKAERIFQETIDFYKAQCHTSFLVSGCILIIWLFFLIFGIAILCYKENKIRKREGRQPKNSNAKDSDSTFVDSFDSGSFKTLLYQEKSDYSLNRLSKILQNIKDSYVCHQAQYKSTPTESKRSLDTHINGNDIISIQTSNVMENLQPFTAATHNSVSTEVDLQTPVMPGNNEYHTSNKHASETLTLNEGTVSLIGENISSINHATCWKP